MSCHTTGYALGGVEKTRCRKTVQFGYRTAPYSATSPTPPTRPGVLGVHKPVFFGNAATLEPPRATTSASLSSDQEERVVLQYNYTMTMSRACGRAPYAAVRTCPPPISRQLGFCLVWSMPQLSHISQTRFFPSDMFYDMLLRV